jgi:hypothetical protein
LKETFGKSKNTELIPDDAEFAALIVFADKGSGYRAACATRFLGIRQSHPVPTLYSTTSSEG